LWFEAAQAGRGRPGRKVEAVVARPETVGALVLDAMGAWEDSLTATQMLTPDGVAEG
jgi:hypothetical protein